MTDQRARVSTIELFFDLVFVFTITRLAHLVEHAHGPLDVLRAFLVLTLVWWMYAGYAWLTNGVGAERRMRVVLIAGMAGFLVIALSIPEAFGNATLTFGLGYLFVVLLHLGAFYSAGGPGIGRATLRLARFNLVAALLVLAAGFIQATWNWIFFLAAALVYAVATLRHTERGFPISASHFVERHGLVIIIALGETIVAIGIGAEGRRLDLATLATIAVSIAFLASLWWSYFDRDDTRAEHAFLATEADQRAVLAIRAFWYPYLVMIFGIVLTAAALKHLIADNGPANTPAWLAAGTATFLSGSVWFRHVMRIRPLIPRAAGAVVALAFVGLAPYAPGLAMLIALTLLMALLLGLERSRYHSDAHTLFRHERETT